jgi:L-histidine N-alpha-methyltransferase
LQITSDKLKHSSRLISERLNIYTVKNGHRKKSFAEDVKDGLLAKNKGLHPKYFYDSKGSDLFEKICETPEYYVTRTEASILKKYSDELAALNSDKTVVVELGSGSSVKTRYIINSFINNNGRLDYMPIDVSEILIESSQTLINDYDKLHITGVISEYEEGMEMVNVISSHPKLVIFLGSSIGNFTRDEAKNLVKEISNNMNETDSFLIGFDLRKDAKAMNEAYNDKQRLTAEFNLNILNRINNELGGEFDLDKFDHYAFFNVTESRMEMHIVSLEDQSVFIKGINETISFKKGETIHTENSYKFTDEMINYLASSGGLKVQKTWKDDKNYFALCLMGKI